MKNTRLYSIIKPLLAIAAMVAIGSTVIGAR